MRYVRITVGIIIVIAIVFFGARSCTRSKQAAPTAPTSTPTAEPVAPAKGSDEQIQLAVKMAERDQLVAIAALQKQLNSIIAATQSGHRIEQAPAVAMPAPTTQAPTEIALPDKSARPIEQIQDDIDDMTRQIRSSQSELGLLRIDLRNQTNPGYKIITRSNIDLVQGILEKRLKEMEGFQAELQKAQSQPTSVATR